jgi:hypothetical protein
MTSIKKMVHTKTLDSLYIKTQQYLVGTCTLFRNSQTTFNTKYLANSNYKRQPRKESQTDSKNSTT